MAGSCKYNRKEMNFVDLWDTDRPARGSNGNDDRQYYHAMVNYLDDVVGDVVAALKSRGMWDNLLFVTSSDNGGPEYAGGSANNYPLRGGKFTDWQGGI